MQMRLINSKSSYGYNYNIHSSTLDSLFSFVFILWNEWRSNSMHLSLLLSCPTILICPTLSINIRTLLIRFVCTSNHIPKILLCFTLSKTQPILLLLFNFMLDRCEGAGFKFQEFLPFQEISCHSLTLYFNENATLPFWSLVRLSFCHTLYLV